MDDKDPRLVRSRNRLVDAASALLKTGGVDAVTVGAVSRMSRVARTTFYRHFDGTTDLLAAAFERLLPHADVPDAHGPIPRQFGAVGPCSGCVDRAGATAIDRLGVAGDGAGGAREQQNTLAPLRARVIAQYREPFDQVLQSAAAQKELDEFDPGVAITQLVGRWSSRGCPAFAR